MLLLMLKNAYLIVLLLILACKGLVEALLLLVWRLGNRRAVLNLAPLINMASDLPRDRPHLLLRVWVESLLLHLMQLLLLLLKLIKLRGRRGKVRRLWRALLRLSGLRGKRLRCRRRKSARGAGKRRKLNLAGKHLVSPARWKQ